MFQFYQLELAIGLTVNHETFYETHTKLIRFRHQITGWQILRNNTECPTGTLVKKTHLTS